MTTAEQKEFNRLIALMRQARKNEVPKYRNGTYDNIYANQYPQAQPTQINNLQKINGVSYLEDSQFVNGAPQLNNSFIQAYPNINTKAGDITNQGYSPGNYSATDINNDGAPDWLVSPQQGVYSDTPKGDIIYADTQKQQQTTPPSNVNPFDISMGGYGGYSAVGHGAATLANLKDGKYDELSKQQRNGLKAGAGLNIALGLASGLVGSAKEVASAAGLTRRDAFVNNNILKQRRQAQIYQQTAGEETAQRQGYLQDYGMFGQNGGRFYGQNGGSPIENFAANAIVDTKGQKFNAELENGEFAVGEDGVPREVVGKMHEEGGVKTTLEENDRVISDNVIVDKDHKKTFEEYGVKVGKKTTYADVIEKFNKKIGIDKLDKEQASYLEKLEKSEKNIKDGTTKEKNKEYLSGKISAIEEEKNSIAELRSFFSDIVYNKQEEVKQDGDYETKRPSINKSLQVSDSESMPIFEDGGEYYTDTEENNQKFQKYIKEHGIDSWDKITAVLQDGGQAPQPQQQMEQPQGGQQEQIMQMVAQALQQGSAPEEVLEYLVQQGIPQEQAVQLIQGVMQQMEAQPQQPQQQQQVEQYRDGGEVPKYQNGTVTYKELLNRLDKGEDPTTIYMETQPKGMGNPYMPFTKEQVREMLSKYPSDEMVVREKIDISAEDKMVTSQKNKNNGETVTTTYGKPAKVDYTFEEFKKNPTVALDRYKALARVLPEKKREQFLKDLEGAKTVQEYDKLAGKLQEFNWNNNQEAILDLAVDEDINQKGLTHLGTIFPKIRTDYPNLFDSEGKAKRGLSGEAYKEAQTKIQKEYIPQLEGDALSKYAATYQDNLAFKRGIELDQQKFNSQEELDAWAKDKKPLKISGETYYKTDKGYYVKPLLGETEAPATTVDEKKKPPFDPGTYNNQTKTPENKVRNFIDYMPLPPEPLRVSPLNTLAYQEVGPIKVSEEMAVRGVDRIAQGNQEVIGNNIGAQQGANIANSEGRQYASINDAITAKNIQNAQYAQQAQQINAGTRLNTDNTNLNLIDAYNRQALAAQSNTYKDIANWYENVDYTLPKGQRAEENYLITADSLNPNVTMQGASVVHDPGGDIPFETMTAMEAYELQKENPEEFIRQAKILEARRKKAEAANKTQTA